MAIPFFNVDVDNVSQLSDLPNSEDGLTSAQLKAVFDKAGSDIKTYINGTLVPNINTALAKAFTVTFPSGETSYNYTSSSYGLTSSSIVYCQPQRSSQSLWNSCDIQCSAVATNKLTFTAVTAPSSDVSIDVLVLN